MSLCFFAFIRLSLFLSALWQPLQDAANTDVTVPPAREANDGWGGDHRMVMPESMPPGWPTGAELSNDDAGWISVRALRQPDEAARAQAVLGAHISVISHFGVLVPQDGVATDANGVTRVGPLVPGRFRVQWEVGSRDGRAFMFIAEDVTVLAGKTADVTLAARSLKRTQWRTRSTGRVTLDYRAQGGVQVTLHDELGVVARAITDERGCYDMAVGVTGTLWLKAAHGPTNSTTATKVEQRMDERVWETLLLRSRGQGRQGWTGDGFAGAAQSAGDLDGDGADDLLITDSTSGAALAVSDWRRMSCLAVSGGTGQLLFRVPTSRFRRSCIGLGGVGDFDGDGTPDFATEFMQGYRKAEPEERGIQVRSGANGRVLVERLLEPDGEEASLLRDCAKEWDLPMLGDLAGGALNLSPDLVTRLEQHSASQPARAGDLDGDGVGDFFMCAPSDEPGPLTGEALLAVSGRTGELLARHVRMIPGTNGSRLIPLADLDGDGLGELLVGNHGRDMFSEATQAVSVHSGADLSPMHVLTHSAHHALLFDVFGIHGCSIGDVNGDGVPDIAVGAMTHNGPCKGSVEIFSGKDGQPLRRVTKEALRPR